MNSSRKTLCLDILWECTGSLLLALSTYNVALYAGFPMTGFSGIALILYRLFGAPMGLVTILLNIPVAVLCYKMIGKNFLLKSLRCMLISSFFLDYIAPLFPVYEGNRMIAAIMTGILGGIGYAVIYMRGSSTGGSDFIIMTIKALKPHMNLGTITFFSDLVIILIGGCIFRDIDGIVYGIIINYLLAVMVDKVILGQNLGKVALIVTENGKEVCDTIDACCMRGSTRLKALGGYQGTKKEVVMAAGTNKDIYQIQKTIRQTEPDSFIIIMESKEVHGEGFQITEVL